MFAASSGPPPPPSAARSRPFDELRELPPVRDRFIRLVGVPFFGLVIPRVTGLFGGLGPEQPAYWLGTLWFVAISFAIWQGNLVLQRWHRRKLDWLQRPLWKLAAMLAANLFYSTPVSVAMLAAWYVVAPLPAIDWAAVWRATALILVAVAIVTHAYETVFLIHERREDRIRVDLTERARWHAELATLKGQLAPHFLFNCLNTLAMLIDEEPRTAQRFNQHLAHVCRYLLKHKEHDLVPLADELAFFAEYAALTRLRYLEGVQVACRGLEDTRDLFVPPASLQLLLENALKHNRCSAAEPLRVEVRCDGDCLVVTNPIRPRPAPAAASGIGLHNLRERFALIVQREIGVGTHDGWFRVTLPMVRRSAGAHPARTGEPRALRS